MCYAVYYFRTFVFFSFFIVFDRIAILHAIDVPLIARRLSEDFAGGVRRICRTGELIGKLAIYTATTILENAQGRVGDDPSYADGRTDRQMALAADDVNRRISGGFLPPSPPLFPFPTVSSSSWTN